METLRVVPTRPRSRDLTVLQENQPVARIVFTWLTGIGKLIIGDRTYTVRRTHRGLQSFVLEQEGQAIAGAQCKRTLFRQVCIVEYAGRQYPIEARSTFRRKLVVREGVQYAGYIEPERAFARPCRACLPASLPMPVRAFIIALAMRLWIDT